MSELRDIWARNLALVGAGFFVGEFVAKPADRPDIVTPRDLSTGDYSAILKAQMVAAGEDNGYYPVQAPSSRRVRAILTPRQADAIDSYWRGVLARVEAGLTERDRKRTLPDLYSEHARYLGRVHDLKIAIGLRDAHLNPAMHRCCVLTESSDLQIDREAVASVAPGDSFDTLNVQRYAIAAGPNRGINGMFLNDADALWSAWGKLSIALMSAEYAAGFFKSEWGEMAGALRDELPNVPETLGAWAAKATAGAARVGAAGVGGFVRGVISELGVPIAVGVGGLVVAKKLEVI